MKLQRGPFVPSAEYGEARPKNDSGHAPVTGYTHSCTEVGGRQRSISDLRNDFRLGALVIPEAECTGLPIEYDEHGALAEYDRQAPTVLSPHEKSGPSFEASINTLVVSSG